MAHGHNRRREHPGRVHDRAMAYEVEVCTQAAMDRLLASDLTSLDRQQHLERWEMQQRGEALYLLAWSDGEMVGRGTVLRESKYENVRRALGSFPEVNALEARIQNIGIGAELMRMAERVALGGGHRTLGVAVELSNPGALRLYERLGYELWTEGVVDRWSERNEEGVPTVEHADDCLYLRKALGS